jgi:hypothetical protein
MQGNNLKLHQLRSYACSPPLNIAHIWRSIDGSLDYSPIEHLQATTLRTAVMNASTIDTSFFNGSHGLRGTATTKASGTKPHLLACAAPTL